MNVEYIKKWQKDNPKKVKATRERFKKRHPERVKTHNRKASLKYYYKNRDKLLKDPKRKLDHNVRWLIGDALKRKKAGLSWEKLVGYTLKDLVAHLEKQFDDKMNWGNYGFYWWLDHRKPRSLFNYVCPEDKEFKECWALNNLQPLEKIANIKKSNNF